MIERRGDPIPGSALVRDFCAGCQEPIRVPREAVVPKRRNYCRACIPPAPSDELLQRSRRGHRTGADADREYDGGRFNAGEW